MEYVAAAMAAIGALSSILGSRSAKDKARAAAKEEARLEGLVTDAKVKSLEVEERVMKGQTLAAAAGSGVNVGVGSPLEILTEQARTFATEKRVTRQAGATRASMAQTRGNMIGSQAYYQGISQGASGLANAFSLFASAKGS